MVTLDIHGCFFHFVVGNTVVAACRREFVIEASMSSIFGFAGS